MGHIEKTRSGASSFQKKALDNLSKATKSMEYQFEEMNKKQDSQSKVFEEAKRAAEDSKTTQDEQLEMVKKLEAQIKKFKNILTKLWKKLVKCDLLVCFVEAQVEAIIQQQLTSLKADLKTKLKYNGLVVIYEVTALCLEFWLYWTVVYCTKYYTLQYCITSILLMHTP